MTKEHDAHEVALAVDSHVHLYDLADLGSLLDAAERNFSQIRRAQPADTPVIGMLVLADVQNQKIFSDLKNGLEEDRPSFLENSWKLSATSEESSLRAEKAGGSAILLIAGQQIITHEKLEVLAVGSVRHFQHGLGMNETLDAVHQHGAYPIIPWGVGKWFGRRGQLIQDLLASNSSVPYCLGDNGGRPQIWSHVRQFSFAQQKNIPVLRGSDPLNLPDYARRAGSFVSVTRGRLSQSHPAADLLQLLFNRSTVWNNFGDLSLIHHFLLNQLALRLRKIGLF